MSCISPSSPITGVKRVAENSVIDGNKANKGQQIDERSKKKIKKMTQSFECPVSSAVNIDGSYSIMSFEHRENITTSWSFKTSNSSVTTIVANLKQIQPLQPLHKQTITFPNNPPMSPTYPRSPSTTAKSSSSALMSSLSLPCTSPLPSITGVKRVANRAVIDGNKDNDKDNKDITKPPKKKLRSLTRSLTRSSKNSKASASPEDGGSVSQYLNNKKRRTLPNNFDQYINNQHQVSIAFFF